jgi:deleted-in-malignant-brain-tumors protein 1
VVWQKTFTAGTVEMRGNNGGDGSYLIFLANPAHLPSSSLTLWSRHLPASGRVKCNNNVDMQYVADQAACQQLAVDNGHPFYSFRHNGEGRGHKCMSSATCDSPLTNRNNEWYIYEDPSQDESNAPDATPAYRYGDIGSGNTCPTSDVSEAECLAAVQSLLPAGTSQGRTTLVAGSWGWVPPGCSVQSHFTHGRDGDWAAHYNRGSGSNDGGYTKVCTGPSTDYMVLGYGMSNCAEGKTIDTHEECEAAHISLGLEVAPKWTGNIGSIPGLCSTREVDWGGQHHFHFNSNPVGVIRVDLSPVCRVRAAATPDLPAPRDDIRLAGGSATRGRLEVFHEGQWGTVCDDAFSLHDATTACRNLGFTRAVVAIQQFGGGSGEIWMDNLACDGTESALTDCGHNGWGRHNCGHHEDAGVECAMGALPPPELRISGGGNSGRLEISYNGAWGTICDDAFQMVDAEVACRQLGFARATAAIQRFGGGEGQIWFDNVGCTGNEASIFDCPHNGWGEHNCGHHEDVGVTCED